MRRRSISCRRWWSGRRSCERYVTVTVTVGVLLGNDGAASDSDDSFDIDCTVFPPQRHEEECPSQQFSQWMAAVTVLEGIQKRLVVRVILP